MQQQIVLGNTLGLAEPQIDARIQLLVEDRPVERYIGAPALGVIAQEVVVMARHLLLADHLGPIRITLEGHLQGNGAADLVGLAPRGPLPVRKPGLAQLVLGLGYALHQIQRPAALLEEHGHRSAAMHELRSVIPLTHVGDEGRGEAGEQVLRSGLVLHSTVRLCLVPGSTHHRSNRPILGQREQYGQDDESGNAAHGVSPARVI